MAPPDALLKQVCEAIAGELAPVVAPLIAPLVVEQVLQRLREAGQLGAGGAGAAPAVSTEYVSFKDAAKIVGFSPRTISDWVRAGKLKPYGRGRSARVRVAEIHELMAKLGGSSELEATTSTRIDRLAARAGVRRRG
jgi:excisionase family DNA binding protein